MASRAIDPEDEVFWREIKEAVKQVELSHGLSFTIERGTKSAYISWQANERDFNSGIQIFITEVEPKQPALMVP